MAIKAKQQIEADMEELNTQIDNLTKAKETVSTFEKQKCNFFNHKSKIR